MARSRLAAAAAILTQRAAQRGTTMPHLMRAATARTEIAPHDFRYTAPRVAPSFKRMGTHLVGTGDTMQPAAHFSTFIRPSARPVILPEKPRKLDEFEMVAEVPYENRGRYPVFIGKDKVTGKLYVVKCLSYFSEAYLRGRESPGFNIEDVMHPESFVKLKQQIEVYATRDALLGVGEKHAPNSIFPVVGMSEFGVPMRYVASEVIADYQDIRGKKFSSNKAEETIIEIYPNVFVTTFGRIAIKIDLSLKERDGNKQNLGIGRIIDGKAPVVTIDHGECYNIRFEKYDKFGNLTNDEVSMEGPWDNTDVIVTQIPQKGVWTDVKTPINEYIRQKVDMLVNGPIYSPFGKEMQLGHLAIKSREAIRAKSVSHQNDKFQDGILMKENFAKSFSWDHDSDGKKMIRGIWRFEGIRGIIYQQAHTELQERAHHLDGEHSHIVIEVLKERGAEIAAQHNSLEIWRSKS